MAEVQAQDDVTFHIKNPGRTNDNFQVTIPLSATVGELQQVISHQYDGQPDPSIQTLIFAGKVLKDPTVRIRDILPQPVDLSLPQNMHLVIRSFQQPSIGSVSSSVDAPTASAAPSTGTASGSSTGPAANNAHSHAGTSSSTGYASMDSRPASVAGPSNPADGGTVDPTAGLGASSSYSGASTSSAAESQVPMIPLMMQPYVVMNPVFAAAYSAAYTAALTAQMSLHAQQQQSGQPSSTMPPMALYYQYPAFGQFPQQPPFQGMPGARPFPGHLQAGMYGYPYPMHGPFPMQPYPQMYGMQPQQQQQQGPRQRFFSVSFARAPPPGDAGQRRARPARVWTIRISMRMLLQLLVFGVVLYQHCTLQRFIVLTVIAVVLWLTRYWDPLRRFMASIAHPPPPHGAAPQPQEGQPAAAVPARNSILREIAVLVLGFLTSLLPAWNYNPDDAAAFAAAQQVVAQEEQEQRQQQNEEAGGQQEGQQPAPPPAADHPHQE